MNWSACPLCGEKTRNRILLCFDCAIKTYDFVVSSGLRCGCEDNEDCGHFLEASQ